MRQPFAHGRVDFVHRQADRLAQLAQQLGEVAVGAGDLGAAVDQEDDVNGLVERHPRLLKHLDGDVLGVPGDDAAGVDHLEAAAVVLGQTVNAVPRDAGLVADNGAPLARDRVEQRGFPYIRPAHDDHRGQALCLEHAAL